MKWSDRWKNYEIFMIIVDEIKLQKVIRKREYLGWRKYIHIHISRKNNLQLRVIDRKWEESKDREEKQLDWLIISHMEEDLDLSLIHIYSISFCSSLVLGWLICVVTIYI